MAKCERRQIKVEPPPVEYVLTMSEAEAAVLAEFVRSGGRWPSNDGRQLNAILWALEDMRRV